MSHSPTPWRVHSTLADEDQEPVIEIREAPYGHRDALGSIFSSEENAEHIVRCVNAHDELVAALRALVDRELVYVNGYAHGITLGMVTDARAALAKAGS